MKALVVGDENAYEEIQEKLGSNWEVSRFASIDESISLDFYDTIFDFVIDTYPEQYELYQTYDGVLFLNTVRVSLAELIFTFGKIDGPEIYGFNGLPGFVQNEFLELSSVDNNAGNKLLKLDFPHILVDDRVGLVTPRVILMIINEAYYTVQEGTASKADIDQGMKLGTNYPFGPFEWAEKIGINQVYETLEAIYEDTHDERYKIAPLLKKEYLAY